ncbi:putative F-box protein At2g02030 [Oryza brachyantha]|uniref:F-box domain-containing protein n=1 Tax=Oryza brachyantha TaxID=4533 RepID=J3LAM4_ORYBR|nr:putative F-box protein At2g02030 [Oryza brachyantha]XP_015688370.1 putative F-box protein At2g02030 [Oryza brachyantha]
MEDHNDEDGQNEAVQSRVCLPGDVQQIILAFLPGRTLLKFSSVCKFWRDSIKEPAFVDLHLDNALRFHQSIACFTSVDNGLIQMYMFDPTTVNFKRTEPVFSSRFHMSEPCNGMMCAYDLKGGAEVLNPTTRKHLTLPESESVPQAPYSEYFLGYVHSTKKYKVVALRHWVRHLTFEVCTIDSLSWRTVYKSEELLKTTKAVVVNGEMHWLVLDDESSHFTQRVLSFNLADEEFSYLDVPNSVRERDLELFKGEGRLYLLSMPCNGAQYTESEIWLADPAQLLWFHMYNVTPRPAFGTKPFFLYKSKLFFGDQRRFMYIDLLDGRVCYIDVPSGENIISSGMFVESFVPTETDLVNSMTLLNGSHHAGSSSRGSGPSCAAGSSSTGPRRSSGVSKWSSAVVQSPRRAKRTTDMVWKMYTESTSHLIQHGL